MIANIIHNPARKDRLQNILEETAEQGIVYRIWPAVMNENPVRGCHLAHRAIVQWAKDNNESAVWIMEDDCVFTSPTAAKRFLNYVPVVYLIYTAAIYGVHKYISKDTAYWYPKTMSGTHCYIVSSDFYSDYLEMDENEDLDVAISQIINPIQKEMMETALTTNPESYALQLPGYSDIVGKDINYNSEKFLQQPLFGTTLEEFNHKCKLKLERYANS